MRRVHTQFSRIGVLVLALLAAAAPVARAQLQQQGPKLFGSGEVGASLQSWSVSLSSDGNTALVGGPFDASQLGAAWVFARSGTTWSQQGGKLVGSGALGLSVNQGKAVALSGDGNTAIIGGEGDNDAEGAAWVWTRTAGTWSEQGKLVGTGAIGSLVNQGHSVALSFDGNTALVGGYGDDDGVGAVWVWTRSGSAWSQQAKLVGGAAVGQARQGISVSLSADGNTAIVGGSGDNNGVGAAWVWTRSGATWTPQGAKLIGGGALGTAFQGQSVSLSADGNTAVVGGDADNNDRGAVWFWTRTAGAWTQQGPKKVGSGAIGSASQGFAVAISGDGNRAIVGGYFDNFQDGAAWVWARSGGVWSQQGAKLFGTGALGQAMQGESVAMSADGNTALVGGYLDGFGAGATWVFATPVYTIAASADVHGAIAPAGVTSVTAGNGASYAITPDPCWHVADVRVDGVSVGPVATYTFSDVQASHTIHASFALDTYTIAASAGPGGSISPAGAVSADCGSSVAFTIAAATGYTFTGLTIDGANVPPVSPHTFTNVGAPHTIAASFTPGTATVDVGPADGTICPANTCVTLPVTISRPSGPPVRSYHVTFQLAGGLALCGGVAGVHEGGFLSAAGPVSFAVTSNGGGSFTVDAALPAGCGPTALTGSLFTIGVTSTFASGPGTVTLTSVALDDCAHTALPVQPGAAGSVPVDNAPPVVSLSSPAGGESWNVGSTHAIVWTATDSAGVATVDLAYSTDGGLTYPNVIATGLANTGSLAWTVPGTPSTQARVRVSAHDVNCASASAASAANFTIAPVISTISAGPAGGTVCGAACVNVPVTIARNDTTPIVAYSVTFRISGGLTLCGGTGGIEEGSFLGGGGSTVLLTRDLGNGTYAVDVALLGACGPDPETGTLFTIPVTSTQPGGRGTVSIGALQFRDCGNLDVAVVAGDSAIVAIDNQPPAVAVTSPVGGENWINLTSHLITWTAFDSAGVASVDLAYSTDGGATFPYAIATGIANTGSYAWTVPDTPTATARVRVTAHDTQCSSASAVSPADFAIGLTVGVGPSVRATELLPASPNPMRSAATLQYGLSVGGRVELAIFSVDGRRVRTLVHGTQAAGAYRATWDGRDDSGNAMHSGVYFARFEAAGVRRTRVVELVR